MVFLVRRMWFSDHSIISSFFIDQLPFGYTLELPLTFDGKENVKEKTCIPYGKYRVVVCSWNPKRLLVLEVPGRDAIEMHVANEPRDIKGCIGVGYLRDNDWIGQSGDAMKELIKRVKDAAAKGEETWLVIEKAIA